MKMQTSSMRLLSGVGFSQGEAEFALTKPPPLVPSSLMISIEAIGPCGIDCLADSSVVAVVYASKFCGTPCQINSSDPTTAIGSSTYRHVRVRSTQKLPIV